MIYLSASSIKDFLSCERKYWYRRFASDQAATTEATTRGTAVHKTIEKYWDDPDGGYKFIETFSEDDFNLNKALLNVASFYGNFTGLLSKNDLIEEKFTIKYSRGVKIVGVFDRITPNGIIIDWKTNKSLPRTLHNDPQFILYHHAYNVLYGKNPIAVYFASLTAGRLVKFKYDPVKKDILLNEIIPDMLNRIKRKEFNPTGLYKYTTCNYCFYREHCHQALNVEKKNELDSKEFNFR